jgi:hypothetical protein
MTVPAAGPYSKTAVKTKVSEIEIEAYVEGSLTVADPLINVKATSVHHSIGGGPAHNWAIEFARTAHPASRTKRT